MHRFYIAALFGGLAGLILNALQIVAHACFPDLPRPEDYRVGLGTLVELQDQLMDRELALYMCKGLAEQGPDSFIRGVGAGFSRHSPTIVSVIVGSG